MKLEAIFSFLSSCLLQPFCFLLCPLDNIALWSAWLIDEYWELYDSTGIVIIVILTWSFKQMTIFLYEAWSNVNHAWSEKQYYSYWSLKEMVLSLPEAEVNETMSWPNSLARWRCCCSYMKLSGGSFRDWSLMQSAGTQAGLPNMPTTLGYVLVHTCKPLGSLLLLISCDIYKYTCTLQHCTMLCESYQANS